MLDYRGERVKEAVPGDPVEVLGFDGVPDAGEFVRVVENDRDARQPARSAPTALRRPRRWPAAPAARSPSRTSSSAIQDGELKELNLVLKADVSGSLEAFEDEIAKLPQDEVQVNVIHSGVGGINESDVMLAAASDAVILGFNVRPVGDARAAGRPRGRRDPDLLGHLPARSTTCATPWQGMLEPEEVEETVGKVEVRQTFRASQDRHDRRLLRHRRHRRAAAPRCASSATARSSTTRRSTRSSASTTTPARSPAGYECGIVLANYQDVKEGDVLEVYETRRSSASSARPRRARSHARPARAP